MKILVLYLKEEISRKKADGSLVKRIPASDIQVCGALEKMGHSVDRAPYDPQAGIRLDKKYDAIYNLCDGLEDDSDFIEFKVLEDIEKTKIPFTGNSLKAVKLCNDKRNIKRLLKKNRILAPNYQVFSSPEDKLRLDMHFPLIVKPVAADGAVGIYANSVVNNEMQLKQRVERVIKKHNQPAALVEEYIAGRDLVIPVIGKKRIIALNPTELRYVRSYKHRPNILSYEAKWAKGRAIYKDCITLAKNSERRFSKGVLEKIKLTAAKVYVAAGCSGYATVDARLDKENKLYIIEINPNCWIGPGSDTAVSFKNNLGWDYPQVIDKILRIALEK